ncbi:short-chain dehydrogenase/reductase [Philodulcilactobacillus myokoensis]|uniref:Short-chain dehydrogenase/reductase n=1 Tax=Philodulcilactobacillus myokoensis TaxID=2929573 RepID=A0A9W6ERY1_9LACO|nr:SDR family NAD(P)-dependent oxidoreductase [Philodulcilactobacillus myokoensis]GLB46340.1 short-chain dehydrogenase/reductase [Philodulcilactobacillus myokoensis]
MKTWLITGGANGLGKSMATLLAKKGNVNLAVTSLKIHNIDFLDQYNHGQILKLQLDVTDKNAIQDVVSKVQSKFGQIDVLDNTADVGYFSSFEEADEDKVRRMFDINVWGTVDMSRAVLPMMRKQRSGLIMASSSLAGIISDASLSFYDGTKHALIGMMGALAQEVDQIGIKVMIVEPSLFRTDWDDRKSHKKETQISDYQVVDDHIAAIEDYDGNEPGNPDKAAQIVLELIRKHYNELPLHLPLGKATVDRGINYYDRMKDHFRRYRNIAKSADYRK